MPDDNHLGFGKFFTDHMFIAHYSPNKQWHDLCIVPYAPITIDPAASVLHYGQSLFEGMKAFRHSSGKIALFRPKDNYLRLLKGAEAICMEAPPEELFLQGIKELIKVDERWVPKTEQCSLYIRPFLFGTEAFLGVRPSTLYTFMIILSPVGNYYAEGEKPIKIWIEDHYVRATPGGLGSVKAGANYAASLRASVRAKEKGYSQVLWLDANHQFIEEVGTMNIFFVFKDEIVTPELNGSILAGVTRDTVIDLLLQKHLPIKERKISIDELLQKIEQQELIEAFGTGTAAVISSIGSFRYKGRDFNVSSPLKNSFEVSSMLKNQIKNIQRGMIDAPQGWIDLV